MDLGEYDGHDSQSSVSADLAARESAFTVLARIFSDDADYELIQALRRMLCEDETHADELSPGLRAIKEYIEASFPDGIDSDARSSALDALKVDYARTFIGSGHDGHSAAYPYESVYMSSKRLLMQQAYREVRKFYRAVGLGLATTEKEPEDYLAYELELIAVLLGRCVDAVEVGNNATVLVNLRMQKDFFEQHLLCWIDPFAEDVMRFSTTSFYRGAAMLLVETVEGAARLADDLLASRWFPLDQAFCG